MQLSNAGNMRSGSNGPSSGGDCGRRLSLGDVTPASVPPIIGLTLNFRDAERTVRCVDSLLSNGAAHVVVWDNSDDEGLGANQLSERLAGNEKVSMLVSPANLGFSAAVNRGIAWISERFGDVWVALINNDAVFLPDALNQLANGLLRQHESILAFPDIDHGGEVVGPVYYQRWLGLLARRRLPGSALYASGCAMLLAPRRLGEPLFDEDFFMYGEDIELGWRYVGRDGWFAYAPGVWVRHEGSASSGMGSEFYESRMVAAHLLLAWRLAKGPLDYTLMIFGRFLTLTARAGLRALRYRSILPVRALWGGWRLFRGEDPLRERALKAKGANSVQLLS